MKKIILEVLASKGPVSEKKLRKYSLKAADSDESEFDSALSSLLKKNKVVLVDDTYSLPAATAEPKRKRSDSDVKETVTEEPKVVAAEEQPTKKAKKEKQVAAPSKWQYEELWKNGEKHWRDGTFDPEYLRTNPDKLFCGNLNKKVTEEELKGRLQGITYIKWITDKQTGEFYGSSFLEMKDPASAALAVLQDKSKFLGRPLKLYYCPPKPGDRWPPHPIGSNMGNPNDNPDSSSAHTQHKGKVAGTNEPPRREKTEKPEGCRKLFAGNLSYNIDDATIVDFFKDCGELVGLRWLTRQGTEEFRGAGYVEFATTEEADAAMKLDGKELLGRNVRLDWTN